MLYARAQMFRLLVGLALALSACGGDDSDTDPEPDAASLDASAPDADPLLEDAGALCLHPPCLDAHVLVAADLGVDDDAGPRPPDAGLRELVDNCSDLYDQKFMPTFEVEIAPEEWAGLQEEFANPQAREEAGLPLKPYHPLLSFRYRDEEVLDAHIRLKGNPFYSWVPPKMQFVISFREVDRGGRFHGLRKINLDAPWYDPTLLRERVATSFVREAGLPGACANNARLLVNGEYYGLYANREHVDKEFLERTFDDPEGNLYKYGWELKTNESEGDVSRRDALNAATDLTTLATLIDRSQALRAWAAEAMIPHYDGYWCCNHNYYIYDHPRRGFLYILHDLDIVFDRGDARTDLFTYGGARPGHLQLAMGDQAWRRDFSSAVAELLPYYDPSQFEQRLDAWSNQIAGAMRQDPNLPFDYQDHVDGIRELRAWFRPRAEYLTEFAERATLCQRGMPGADLDRDGFDECVDCNDLDRNVFPGAVEACNERDDDCNGVVDDAAVECAGDCTAVVAADAEFLLCSTPQRWYDGYQTCARHGGQLGVPLADELPALLEGTAAVAEGDWWLGANDADEEDRWVGVDGVRVGAPPWAPDQPSGGADQNCALLRPDGTWNDATCTDPHPVVCRL